MSKEEQSSKFIRVFKSILPSPFTIAILLTIITLIIAQFVTKPHSVSHIDYFLKLVTSWKEGLWDDSAGGLYFAFQMMLILVLGHILALTPAVDRLIQSLLRFCTNTATSAMVVAIGAIVLGLINWGLGLIFGAIMARKVGEKFAEENRPLNYGLVGAAGYVCMMVWHGGLSGSATTKAMEMGYIPEMMENANIPGTFPNNVPFGQTIGSVMNLSVALACLIIIPSILYFLGKRLKNERVPDLKTKFKNTTEKPDEKIQGAERLDYTNYLGTGLGIAIIILGFYTAVNYEGESSLGFIQLNFINFMFLGLSLALHQSIRDFSKALGTAINDVAGILIQFPFYFGILAIMQASGLIEMFAHFISTIATDYTLPLFTFLSASTVNFFVPSGGGQWAIQGPIIIQTAQELNSDISKNIMALAYGDQLSNMLQPFWALPLLGITKLKPQQLLPYSFLMFVVGFVIFATALLIF